MSAAQTEIKRLANKLVDFYGRLEGTSLAMQVLYKDPLGKYVANLLLKHM